MRKRADAGGYQLPATAGVSGGLAFDPEPAGSRPLSGCIAVAARKPPARAGGSAVARPPQSRPRPTEASATEMPADAGGYELPGWAEYGVAFGIGIPPGSRRGVLGAIAPLRGRGTVDRRRLPVNTKKPRAAPDRMPPAEGGFLMTINRRYSDSDGS